jgi:hypothetical protein
MNTNHSNNLFVEGGGEGGVLRPNGRCTEIAVCVCERCLNWGQHCACKVHRSRCVSQVAMMIYACCVYACISRHDEISCILLLRLAEKSRPTTEATLPEL